MENNDWNFIGIAYGRCSYANRNNMYLNIYTKVIDGTVFYKGMVGNQSYHLSPNPTYNVSSRDYSGYTHRLIDKDGYFHYFCL